MSIVATGASGMALDVEEQRLTQAQEALPEITGRYQSEVEQLLARYRRDGGELTVTRKVAEDGNALWRAAVKDVQAGFFDDRALYWDRLAARIQLKQQDPAFALAQWQRGILLTTLEKASRGMSDIQFDEDTDVRILVTGFDPFFLDRDIGQSNPSGLAALALDGKRWNQDGKRVQIESVLIPVRFADFDQGLIESLLSPYLRDNSVDMVVTVSMGRDQFDLERFPGRHRSAEAPDNLNVLTGASKTQPLSPQLNGDDLHGPEFVEFSLPVAQMLQAEGAFKVVDNRKVTTKMGSKEAIGLYALNDAVSIEGSGGGYLSNEISYRSILLKELLGSSVPIGHIHTPKVAGYDEPTQRQILAQLESMLALAAQQL
ncbi:C15 family peptidase [Ferrimonas marina]|uniref:Pyrrolidone-carboxylate peptidase (N-terminal pyroglutamyl peptidase) n=1 Tax=Ferrimonas marina TaxID=299255 RepID=A0A1M5VV47_9GAMM|nr:hypothetical protein [Ferrimonas marina]SHH79101.1 Pyrrolidone-carboxylate peptidase (N-terminal pyroglutamyl peptidase) [Ferrimonas marina]